jgi:hypothetical protein
MRTLTSILKKVGWEPDLDKFYTGAIVGFNALENAVNLQGEEKVERIAAYLAVFFAKNNMGTDNRDDIALGFVSLVNLVMEIGESKYPFDAKKEMIETILQEIRIWQKEFQQNSS